MQTIRRKYKWGALYIRANMSQASDIIKFKVNDEDWKASPFQVADVSHSKTKAFYAINDWLKGQ